MKKVGIYEAKTQLPKLVEEVEKGATVTITRHGKPVALLVPTSYDSAFESKPKRTPAEVIAAIREFRERHPADGTSAKELIEEGRRI